MNTLSAVMYKIPKPNVALSNKQEFSAINFYKYRKLLDWAL